MSYACPVCHQTIVPPSVSSEEEDIMGTLFNCGSCQSVLKWDGQSIKVIRSKEKTIMQPAGLPEQDLPQEDFADDLFSPELEKQIGLSKQAEKQAEGVKEEESNQQKQEIKEAFTEEEKNQTETEEYRSSSKDQSDHQDLEAENLIESTKQENRDEKNTLSDHLEAESGLKAKELEEEVLGEYVESSSQEMKDVISDNLSVQESQEEESKKSLQEEPLNSTGSQSFSDVASYGNSEISSQTGFLRYDISVSGLDNHEIEKEVLSILEDPRFQWSADDILKSAKQGELVIKNLNPIKAMCLISELSFVSVTLRWKQYMAVDATS